MKAAKLIWMDGDFKPWFEANTHVLSHTLHYGCSVFEGVRAYMTEKGLAIYKLEAHTKRLLESAKIVGLSLPYAADELNIAQIEILAKQKDCFQSGAYIRPIAFLGYGSMGLFHKTSPVVTCVAAWEWGTYLGDEGFNNGIRVKISSYTRNHISASFGKAKVAANYLNSSMAFDEAKACGFDEALLLDANGFVAEGSGECLFIIKDKVLITPPNDNSLRSITQASMIQLAQDIGFEVVRSNITRDELYVADEAFFTGTAAEVTPIREIDGRVIGNGKRGSITQSLQSAYIDVVYGRNDNYLNDLTFI